MFESLIEARTGGSVIRKLSQKYVVVGIILFGVLSIGMVGYSQWLSSRAFEKNAGLIRLIEHVQQDVATAHLWFEEALGGDTTIDLKVDVHDRLAAAISLIDAWLRDDNGQLAAAGAIVQIHENLLLLRQRITLFDQLVDTRWLGRETTGVIGGAEDQAFDGVFREILELSRTIGGQLDLFIAADQRKILAINIVIFIILAGLFAAMAVIIEKSRRATERRSEELESLVQQRTASLAASEAEARKKNTELALARDQANAASKAKSQFLANMSHEIRTPMNGVMGMASLLQHTELTATQQQYVDTMHNSGLSLLKIINAVLDFSKIEAGKLVLDRVDFALSVALDNVVQLFLPEANQKNLKLKQWIADDVPAGLHGDPVRLGQILSNLVSNAIKFSDDGEIVVTCERNDYFAKDADSVELLFTVRDCGVGIAFEQQSRLFEQFSQVDESATRSHGGTGLGLAISKELTSLMEGTIGVESVLGDGSSFWFTARFGISNAVTMARLAEPGRLLSASGELGPTAARTRISMRPPTNSSNKVLVVDDNDVNQLVAERMLEQLGYSVDLASNGQEAIDATASNDYAAILIDCQMPGMDGNAATAEIRKLEGADYHTPIIALTANALAPERAKAFAAGVDDYLSKPVFLETLEAALNRLLGGVEPEQSPIIPAPRKVASSTSDAVLDPVLIAELSALGGVDPDFFKKLAGQFRDQLPGWIGDLREVAVAGDMDGVRRQAHKLLGMCRQLGAQRMARICNEVESLAPDIEPGLITECIDRLQLESDKACQELDEHHL